MDLNTFFSADQPAAMQLENPQTYEPLDHEGAPIRFFIWSPDSTVMQEAERKISNITINKAVRAGRNKVSFNADDNEAQVVMRFMAAIDGWENVYVDGMLFEVNDENKKTLLTDAPRFRWIRNQIEEFYGDRGNFLKKST